MFSVTQRVKMITQPRNGFLPISSFSISSYDDGIVIDDSSPMYAAFAGIQGMVVDYMTRFMSSSPVEKAFEISLKGAEIVGEKENAIDLLKSIRGLDKKSVLAACKLVKYDVAYRRGMAFYSDTAIEPSETIIRNIQIMVERGMLFLRRHRPIVYCGFSFEGGYTKIVSSGDGDYLTLDGLWDFKVSRKNPGSIETLQILLYYIMGYHSIHPEFKEIRTLGLYNPLKNQAYEIDIKDIPDLTLMTVSRDVLGLRVPTDPKLWYNTCGEDERIINNLIQKIIREDADTGFRPDNYEDGIYDITVQDYWTYFRNKSDTFVRPKFSRTDHIKFLKHGGFLMFISVSTTDSICLLHGGYLRKLEKPIQYYYDHLPEYGNKVLAIFSKYWDGLYDISRYVQRIVGGIFPARVHGCIVDLDYFNHIFLNPFDGTITPYYAETMSSRHTYQNLASLMSAQMPELLPLLKKEQLKAPASLALEERTVQHHSLALTSQEIISHSDIVYGTDMYGVSNRLKVLQTIYDYHLVSVWYDSIIEPAKLPGATLLDSTDSIYTQKWINAHFNDYISAGDECKDKAGHEQAIVWETKCEITQDELFALVRKLLSENADALTNVESLCFGYSWCPSNSRKYQYVSVTCAFKDIKYFYKTLLKKRSVYKSTIIFHLDFGKFNDIATAEVSVFFSGGTNPLLAVGEYRFENGAIVREKS